MKENTRIYTTNTLKKINFLFRYKQVTDEFCDLHSRWIPTKKEVEALLVNLNQEFKYNLKDKMFFITNNIDNNYLLKFMISYKFGAIEAWIQIFSEGKIVINNRFDFLGELIEAEYRDSLALSLPICTSVEDLNVILKVLYDLYNDFKTQFLLETSYL